MLSMVRDFQLLDGLERQVNEMPNLFSGFPVSRAKVAEIITGEAAPKNHVTDHESGGDDELSVTSLSGLLGDPQTPLAHDLDDHGAVSLTDLNSKISGSTLDDINDARPPDAHASSHELGGGDEMDVTGLTGAGGAGGLEAKNYFISTWFEGLECYDESTSGTGSITNTSNGLIIWTGSTSGSYALLRKSIILNEAKLTFSNSSTVVFLAQLAREGTNGPDMWLTVHSRYNAKHFGFKITGNLLQGTCGNGSASTQLTLYTLPSPGTYEDFNLRAEFTPGDKVEFFINDVSIGSITTNLPSGEISIFYPMFLWNENGSESADSYITMYYFSFFQSIS